VNLGQEKLRRSLCIIHMNSLSSRPNLLGSL